MSEETVKERLIRTLHDLEDHINDKVESDRREQMRLRSLLIRALYWLDRWMTEQYFRERSDIEGPKSSRTKSKSKRRK